MRYMMLVYTQNRPSTPETMEAIFNGHAALMEETARRGILLGADPLKPPTTATTVRRDGDKVLVLDGPFAETKEQLAGYYLLECKDLDEAIEWASRIPTACGGGTGCVEIREIQQVTRPAAVPPTSV